MGKLTDEEIQAVVAQEIYLARGYDQDELAANRQQALKYYLGRPRGDEVVGQATLQSLDVGDAVNATMAQLAPQMKATLVEFVPDSQEDEDQAQLESDFCMFIANRSNAYREFSNAAFDALLQQNGWLKVFVDENVSYWTEDHEGLTDVSIVDALTPSCPGDVVKIETQTEDDGGLYHITVSHTVTRKKLCIEAVPPEYMLFAQGHKSMDVSNIRFIGERKLMTRSQLIQLGYNKQTVEELPAINSETWTAANERTFGYDNLMSGKQDATEVVEVFECYMELDRDNNGEASLHRVMLAGDGYTFLACEPARFIPYCTGSALPLPHRLIGQSMYDQLRYVQDGKTHVLRQWLNNHTNANQSRVAAVEGQANLQDLVSARPGGVIRVRSPDAITPMAFNDVGPSCQNALGYLDDIRSNRAGAAIDMTNAEMQIAGTSATAAANEYGNKEKMSAFYARNIVESLIRGAYLLIHQAMRVYYDENMSAKLRGKWASTNPKQWPMRDNVRVVGGLSDSERMQKAQGYAQLIQYQSMAMQAGLQGELINGDGLYAALADWQRIANLGEVEEYWVDPSSQEAQQAAQGKQQQAQEQKKEMEALQQRMFDQEQQLKKYMHDTELQYKYFDSQLDAEVKEAEMVADNVTRLEQDAMKQAGGGDGQENA